LNRFGLIEQCQRFNSLNFASSCPISPPPLPLAESVQRSSTTTTAGGRYGASLF
jgi:hypothetical protein